MNTILRFINNSSVDQREKIIVFQKNISNVLEERAVAWNVLPILPKGSQQILRIPTESQFQIRDFIGNYSKQILAKPGIRYKFRNHISGDHFTISETELAQKDDIKIVNMLASGPIDMDLYKDGKLLAFSSMVIPGDQVSFNLSHHICC